MRVSVVGGGTVTDELARLAEAVGREIGSRGHTLVYHLPRRERRGLSVNSRSIH